MKKLSQNDYDGNRLTNVGDPTSAQDAATKSYVDSLPLSHFTEFVESSSFTITPTSSQGIAWDGTYSYVSNNTHIYKYNSSGVLQTSRDISLDGTVDHIGGMTYYNGTLYVAANNYPTTPKVSYVMRYNPTTLAYIGQNLVTAGHIGSLAYKDSAFWLVYDDRDVLEKWPTSLSSLTASYTIESGTSGYNGIEWMGESLVLGLHEGDEPAAFRQFYFTGSELIPIRNIARPSPYCSQDLAWNSTSEVMYFNKRGYSIVSDGVVTAKPKNTQEKLPNRDGWVPFPVTISRSSWSGTTYTAVVNCSGADEFLSKGMRVKFAQPTNLITKYGIVTDVSSTTFTVFMGTDYDVDAEVMWDAFYSHMKAPLGFPLEPEKYTLTFTESTDRSVAATGGTWYNVNAAHQLVVPKGAWRLSYKATVYAQNTGGLTAIKVYSALSTSTTAQSNEELFVTEYIYDATVNVKRRSTPHSASADVTLSANTTYYLIAKQDANGTLDIRSNADPDVTIKAVCTYL